MTEPASERFPVTATWLPLVPRKKSTAEALLKDKLLLTVRRLPARVMGLAPSTFLSVVEAVAL